MQISVYKVLARRKTNIKTSIKVSTTQQKIKNIY